MGFDIECIQNIQSLAGEYFCPVCRLLVYPDEALQTQCTHLYCKPCLAYVVSNTHTCPYDGYPVTEAEAKPLKEVNQALAETIGHIAVTCLYHRSGCTWQGTLSESTNHCSGCSFGNSPVMCNRCGAQIVHRQVLEHSQICPGEQPLAQQVENTTAATEQGQTTTQAGVPASQDQNSQNAVAAAAGQGQSQGAPVAQPPAVVHAPTPEQWYQQQQQYYQQYYQQYPGYDPYQQQYQQYAQYHQQQLQQQVQAHPQQQVMPGQPHPQPYMQPPPQPHVQPQPQVQPQLQTQVQVPVQSQPQVQPQPQAQPQGQPQPQASQAQAQAQPQPQPQMPVQPQLQPQVNPQPQPHAPVQPHPQMQPQTHPPSHAQIQADPLGHLPHSQQHPQAHPQAHPQQHSQMSHPQPHPQLPHARPHVQHPPQQQPHHPHAQPQSHPQHPHMQWQPPPTQPPPYLQAPPQTHPPHFQPQPQPQPINPAAHAVTGHQSYQQPRPHQQMPQGSAQQHPMNVHPQPQVAAHQLPQNPSQFPHQQTPHMRPPNPVPHSHGPGQHPHQPSMLPAQGQHPNAPPVQQQQQQQQSYPQAHQPGHQIQHPPGMQPLQHQPMPHQQAHGIVHQSQPFPGAAPPSALNQPSQQGILMPLQPMQQQQPFRAQAPSSLQQHAQNHLQWQHNVPSSQGMMSHQQKNPSGRPVMPVHATMQQPYLHPAGGAAGPTHGQDSRALVKPGQVGGDQLRESLVPQPGSQTKVSSTDGPSILSREDSVPEKVSKVPEGEAETVSNGKDSTTARIVVDSADSKISKSENNSKSRDDEDKPQVGTADGDAPTGRGKDMESSNTKADSEEPAKKPMVNEEASERLSADMALENHEDVLKMDEVSLHAVKEEQDGVPHGSLSSQKLEALEGKNVKMQQDAVDPRSSQLLLDAKNAIPKGHVSGNEKSSVHVSQQLPAAISIEKNPPQQSLQNVGPNLDRPLNRPGYQDGIMPQFPRQGPGPDEYRGFPPPVQMPTAQSGYPAPSPFGQPPLIPDGPQRPPAPHQMHMQGPMRPQGPLQGHPSTFHGSVPTGILPAASFGREPGHFGHPQGIFEPHPTPQGANQGPMPPPHAGGPRFSQGEAFAGPPLSGLPPGPFGSPRGMVARGPPQGSEGQIGRLHSTNPMQAEMFANRRPGFFDGKGLVGGTTEDRFKPYPERLKPIPEESLKLPPEDHFKPFSLEQSHRVIDRREFEEDLKQFPRPAHLDSETKFENHLSASRHLDRVQHGFGVDRPLGFGCDVVPDGSGSFPVGSAGPSVHPVDIGDRTRPANLTDSMGKKMDAAGSRPDVLGPVSDYGRHRMDMPARSPGRDYPGIPPRRFGGSSAFGLGSGSLPSHLRRGEADGPRNFMAGEPFGSGNLPVHLRNSDLAGSDIVPGHMRAGEHLGPRHIPGHLRIGEALGPDHLRMLEPTGFGGFPSHLRMGELAGPGNLPSHLPGFGSTMPIYGLPNEGGFFNQGSKGDMESFDHSRKRKPGSMGWCRICKIDCETVEGLELHSQTREHQKMAMDMVLSIKQDNAKKQKVSSEDRVSLEDANKSRKPGFENRGNRR